MTDSATAFQAHRKLQDAAMLLADGALEEIAMDIARLASVVEIVAYSLRDDEQERKTA